MARFPWQRRKVDYSETDKVRQGTGPLDNLVVLVTSVALAGAAGVWIYFWYVGSAG